MVIITSGESILNRTNITRQKEILNSVIYELGKISNGNYLNAKYTAPKMKRKETAYFH